MELLQYTFFQHALIGSLLASIVCGIIGTYIVTRRLVFISGGLTHASFGGIGLGLYAGISPILSAAVFSVLSAFGVEWLSKRKDMREDSAIAVFWTLGMALGIIFTFLSPGFAPDLSAYLFGNILTITFGDIALLGGLAALLILFFSFFLHPIIYVAFDREFARSQGIPVQTFEYVLMMFIALTIVACLRMVGIVLVISLLTIPQMTANLFSHRFHRIIRLSVGIGFSSFTCPPSNSSLYMASRKSSGCLWASVTSVAWADCSFHTISMFLREQPSSSSPLLFMQSVKGEKVFGYLCRKSDRTIA